MINRRFSVDKTLAPQAVVNGSALTPFFSKARTRRVDWIDLGDSNELFGGNGRNHGIQYALRNNGIPLYGTGLFSGNENNGSGSGVGYFCNSTNNGGRPNDNGSPPAGLNAYNQMVVGSLSGPQFFPQVPWILSDAQSDANNTGFTIQLGGPFDVNAAWRGWWRYGTFTSGSGSFRPSIRRGSAPFTTLISSATIPTGGSGGVGLLTTNLNIVAAARDYNIDFRWEQAGTTLQGPIYALWLHADCLDIPTGIQYSTMVARGGQGLFEYIQCVQASATGVEEFLRCACEAQEGSPTLMICINSGFNDRNDAADLSLGPIGGLPSDTPEGFADNMRGIIIALQDAWDALGYDRSDLYFLMQVSHPISSPDDADLIAYRAACIPITAEYENTASSDLSYFYQPLNANGVAWYQDNASDRLHMKIAGYEQFSNLWISDLLRGA